MSSKFQAVLTRHEAIVALEDAQSFQNTILAEAWAAMREMEAQMGAHKSFRGLVEKYSEVVEVLCNGTPYHPRLWVPLLYTEDC